MSSVLVGLIDMHEKLLAEALQITEQIDQISRKTECDIDQLTNMTEAREKKVAVLVDIQTDIERIVRAKATQDVDSELMQRLKDWYRSMSEKITMINRIDQVIVSFLEKHKKTTSEHISETYQSKEKLKGYNLNNVKK